MDLWSARVLSIAVAGILPLLSACAVPPPPPPEMPVAATPPVPAPRRVVRAVRPRRTDPAGCTTGLSDDRKQALFRQFDAQSRAAEPATVAVASSAAEPLPCRGVVP